MNQQHWDLLVYTTPTMYQGCLFDNPTKSSGKVIVLSQNQQDQ